MTVIIGAELMPRWKSRQPLAEQRAGPEREPIGMAARAAHGGLPLSRDAPDCSPGRFRTAKA